MPVTDYDDFRRRAETDQYAAYWATLSSGVAGTWMQTWRTAPSSSPAPSSGEVCTSTFAANLFQGPQPNNGTTFYLAEVGVEANVAVAAGHGLLVDRLVHNNGLVLNVGSSQNTNLPTLALNRSTDGVGVHAALVCWTSAANSTAITGTIQYTNQAGTAGRLSPAFAISTAASADRMWHIPLQAGDFGVRSVEWFQVSASITVAGSFGIVLYKPLAVVPISPYLSPNWPRIEPNYQNKLIGGGGGVVSAPSSMCLDLFTFNMGTAAATLYGRTNWIETS